MAVPTAASKAPKQKNKPQIVSVYRVMDGAIHHRRCHQRMTYQGVSAGGLELEFHCPTCHERVMLPYVVASRLPVTTSGAV